MFSFGAISDNLTRAQIAPQGYGDQGIPPGELVIMGCLGVVVAAAVFMIRLRRFMNEWTYLMNVVGTILVFLPLTNIAMATYVTSSARSLLPDSPALPSVETVSLDAAAKPDIYHLVLDGYGSEDVFRDNFDYDNSDLTKFLESKGFWVARNARSTTVRRPTPWRQR